MPKLYGIEQMIGRNDMLVQKRLIGDTGIKASALGLGTVKFGRNQGVKYPKTFNLPSDKQASDLLALAQDMGINLLDTAPAYGTSEKRLGSLLKGQRDKWVIVGKAGEEFENGESHYDFTPSHLNYSVERSLKRLNTDYIDMLLIHSDGRDLDILANDDLIHALQMLKKRGLIRAIGASTKTAEGGIRALEIMDVVMACYHPAYVDEKSVLDYAQKNNKGVLLKKLLASGHVNTTNNHDPVQSAMDFAFSHGGTGSAIVGTITPKHLIQNVESCIKATLPQ